MTSVRQGPATGAGNGSARGNQEIPGWFFWLDRQLFATFLAAQRDRGPGDLVELGTYLGKSAVVIGEYLRPGERFVALDLFGRTDLLTDEHQPNRREVEQSYASLTRMAFEDNYRSRHADLPIIVEGPSSVILEHVAPHSVRFVHIDASHLYAHVRLDARNAKAMMQPGGLVVFDDWRSEHTPGVTAAVWEAVFADGLIPVAVTPTKFYGVFSQPDGHRAALQARLDEDRRITYETQEIAGHPVFRLRLRDQPARVGRSDDELARKISAEVSSAMIDRLPGLLNDSSTITRVRRWLRDLRRGQRIPRTRRQTRPSRR